MKNPWNGGPPFDFGPYFGGQLTRLEFPGRPGCLVEFCHVEVVIGPWMFAFVVTEDRSNRGKSAMHIDSVGHKIATLLSERHELPFQQMLFFFHFLGRRWRGKNARPSPDEWQLVTFEKVLGHTGELECNWVTRKLESKSVTRAEVEALMMDLMAGSATT